MSHEIDFTPHTRSSKYILTKCTIVQVAIILISCRKGLRSHEYNSGEAQLLDQSQCLISSMTPDNCGVFMYF